MKQLKKALLLLSALALLLLCACGKGAAPTLLPGSTVEESPEPTPPPTPAPTPTPEPTPEPTPPPPDIDINGFQYVLANSFNSVGWEFAPPYGGFEGQGIDVRITEALQAFLTAAREAGYNVWCSAIYRNGEYLTNRFSSYIHNVSSDPVYAAEHVLAQGLDEHQTGLAVDFTDQLSNSARYESFEDDYMKDTELFRWLKENCSDYGFILRYPEGKEAYYGTPCNHPAHFRYVGVEEAKYIEEHDLCLEEFLLLYDGNTVFVPQP